MKRQVAIAAAAALSSTVRRLSMAVAQITIRHAVASERESLEAIQWRASLNNPGDRAALMANPDAVELPRGQIERGGVFVAEVASSLKGWAAILPRNDGD